MLHFALKELVVALLQVFVLNLYLMSVFQSCLAVWSFQINLFLLPRTFLQTINVCRNDVTT